MALPAAEFLALAHRRLIWPGGPRTLDEAMADDIQRRVLCGFAHVLAHRAARAARRTRPAPAAPAGHLLPRLPRLTFDPRRAAANDHDEP